MVILRVLDVSGRVGGQVGRGESLWGLLLGSLDDVIYTVRFSSSEPARSSLFR